MLRSHQSHRGSFKAKRPNFKLRPPERSNLGPVYQRDPPRKLPGFLLLLATTLSQPQFTNMWVFASQKSSESPLNPEHPPTVDGRNPASPKKPWETIVCGYLHGNHDSTFLRWCEMISSIHSINKPILGLFIRRHYPNVDCIGDRCGAPAC